MLLIYSKLHANFLCSSLQAFCRGILLVQVVQPYSSTDTAWNISHFILSERSDVHIVVKLSVVVYTLLMYVEIAFSK